MGVKDPRVDEYIGTAPPFARPILTRFRKAVHAGCPDAEEAIKWGHPAFVYKGLLAAMSAHKAHVRLIFWKGDAVMAGEGQGPRSRPRLDRISAARELPDHRTLTGIVTQAAALHDAGVKARRRAASAPAPAPPDDLLAALRKNRKAMAAFEQCSPSHRREYIEWIQEAKRDATRRRRIETAVKRLTPVGGTSKDQ